MAIGAILEIVFSFLPDLAFLPSGESRGGNHPRYGIPRSRVRSMKRTAQGRIELKRMRKAR